MEALNLNRIPVGSNPVVHVSQYDVGRVFRFNLFDGSNVYTLDGTETIECNVRKLDGNVVTVGVTNTSSDYIDVITTEQMTAIHGQNYGEIVFKKGGNVIGSVNFILQVEQSPLEGGITSDSAIYNLEVQVANYVAIEVANQYDSANVIFDATPTVGHGNGYTVTSEGIGTALDTKQDLIATKSASGSLIHITDGGDNIPMKSLVSEIVAVETGNGQPKSPTNPYSISGFANGVVTRCGKNFVPMTVASVKAINTLGTWSGNAYTYNNVVFTLQTDTDGNITGISANGTASATSQLYIANNYTLQKGNYILNGCPSGGGTETARLQVNTSALNIDTGSGANITLTEVYNSCVCFIRIGSGYNPNGMVFKPMVRVASDTDDTFAISKNNIYTFPFGQTVYGGHFDNKGNLVVTNGYIEFDGSNDESWQMYSVAQGTLFRTQSALKNYLITADNTLCNTYTPTDDRSDLTLSGSGANFDFINNSISNVNDWRTYLSNKPITVCFELATPITLAITSQNIPTLLGENNIFSNCGDVEVEYFSNTVDGLVTLINDFTVKNATELPISDSDPTDTKSYIDTGLGGKADTSTTYTKTEVNNLLADKQNKNVLNIVKHYDSGTSSDAITDIITEYGKVNMVFAFDIPLGYFTGCLTFSNDNMGSGFIVLSTTGRFWVVSYVSGTITLTELT